MKKIEEDGWLEEYKTLRDESLKRMELSFTILNLAFIAAGGIWGVAIGFKRIELLLFYPILSFLFSLGFIGNGMIAGDIGHYIREVLENEIYELRWAKYFRKRDRAGWITGTLFVGGIFVGGSVFSLALFFILRSEMPPAINEETIKGLLWIGGLSALATLSLVLYGAYFGASDKEIAAKIKEINTEKDKKIEEINYPRVKITPAPQLNSMVENEAAGQTTRTDNQRNS